ncbi:MAG: addiction module protein [Trueperaceae bacterium]
MISMRKDIKQLSVPDRLELIEYLWDSITASGEKLEVTQAQKSELDTRLQRYEQDKQGKSWDKVKARLKQSK